MRFFDRLLDHKKGKGLRASQVLDTPHAKFYEASFDGEPWFFAIALSDERREGIAAKGYVGPQTGIEGGYATGEKMNWRVFYNPSNMRGFVTENQIRGTIAGTLSAASGFTTFPSTMEIHPITFGKPGESFAKLTKQVEVQARKNNIDALQAAIDSYARLVNRRSGKTEDAENGKER